VGHPCHRLQCALFAKGRVERAIRYVRDSFFAGRVFTTIEGLNRQALVWRDTIAHRRPWPGDDTKTVEQAFEEEKPRLIPLPANSFDTDLVVPIRSGKTIYVRFDLNDYSIPPEAVGHQLTLVASESTVRLLEGTHEITRHRRSYDRHQQVLDPAHQEALLAEKRKAIGSTPGGRLVQAVPDAEALLDAAFTQGESAGRQTAQLVNLLDLYGASELRAAVREALDRKTPRASSVAFILNKRVRSKRQPFRATVTLSHRPELNDLAITPHNLENYDDLANNGDPNNQ